MVSSDTRFFLRLDSDQHGGRRIPIPQAGLTVGRRPQNALVLGGSSVSGQHAELTVDGDSVTVRDLGSTNGTRVGGEKIESRRLAHGDVVVFGTVRCVFLDDRLAEPGPSSEPAPGDAADLGAPLGQVSTDRLASAGRRSIWGALVLVLLVVAAGFLWPLLGGSEEAGTAGPEVVVVAGNLLAQPSFEGADSPLDWESLDAAPAVFHRDPAFRRSGALGLGVDLEGGDWSRARSPSFRLRGRRGTRIRAELAADPAVTVCLGLELEDSSGDTLPITLWTRPVRDTGGFETVELALANLPGFDRGCVVVAARADGAGSASVDDLVVLEEASAPAPLASIEEYALHGVGTPATSLALVRAGTLILGGIEVQHPDAGGGPAWPAAELSAAAGERGLSVTVAGAAPPAVLAFQVDAGAIAAGGGDDGGRGWIATTGPAGFRSYSSEFEAPEATSLILGRGIDMLRVGFSEPLSIRCRMQGGAIRIAAGPGDLSSFEIQLDFQAERAEARRLRFEAERAERTGDGGAALAAWSELLDRYPFEAELVELAGSARSRLLQAGHQELNGVRQELERARFFLLADLFRECLERASAIGARYAGSDVEAASLELAATIEGELADFERGAEGLREERLQRILEVVAGKGWTELADRVRHEIERGVGDR